MRALLVSSIVCGLLLPPVLAQASPVYAVMSLAGDQLSIHATRPDVGTRTSGTSVHVLPVAEQVFDEAILLSVDAALKRAGTTPVLMMTQDRELYKAANGMFEQPAANGDNRTYLQGLLRERKASHLVLVTRLRDNAPVKLSRRTSVSNGVLEGLGFYVDDTTQLIDDRTAEAYFGMVAPFAYLKIRVLDAATLSVLQEKAVTFSFPVVRPSNHPSGMATWTGMTTSEKLVNIRQAVDGAVEKALPLVMSAQ